LRRNFVCEFATEFLPQSLPLYLWIDLRAGRTDSGKMAGFTRGLEALGHREFETEDSPEAPGELRERFIGLASYVLENGPVIQDGDTVGDSADHKIRVVHSPSAFGNEGQVMKLIHSAPPPRGRFPR